MRDFSGAELFISPVYLMTVYPFEEDGSLSGSVCEHTSSTLSPQEPPVQTACLAS